jgi:radical SAM superfamily enzyme YgiQ (UPF0313 family)
MTLRIFLADLYHDYLPTRQHTPLGIGYIGEYLKIQFPQEVEIRLFKSPEKFLKSIDEEVPDVIGMSNYTWNQTLNHFVGKRIRSGSNPNIPIIMGGPNIRLDDEGILSFLELHNYVDRYAMFSGERPMADIICKILELAPDERNSPQVRELKLKSSYAIDGDVLCGGSVIDDGKDLDFVPSPYLSGALDEFLNDGFLPILETNRGCPFSCTFCVWGISALSKIKQFGMERVKAELGYVVSFGVTYPEIVYADANFGILKRDVEIARSIKELHDTHQSFQAVQFYWSKSAQPHMIDIGRHLGHLTHTYVAFQSLDPVVLEAIKRKNIGTDKLAQLIDGLREFTHSTQTDLLVGLPNEDFDSHIRSLETALGYGIDLIMGGEIRMLPGSELDSRADREKYKIKTKYRLCEGQYGYYQGELVSEFEEVIRETSTMSETEMLRLRVLRTIFFASVTIGEHRPLIRFLVKNNFSIVELFKRVSELDSNYPAFDKALNWCMEQASQEWFDTLEDGRAFFKDKENVEALFDDKPFLKLNYGMFARLLKNPDEYEDFTRKMKDLVLSIVPKENNNIVKELFQLCSARNLLRLKLTDIHKQSNSIKLSKETWAALKQIDYVTDDTAVGGFGECALEADPISGTFLGNKISELEGNISVLNISQILESFRGRTYLEPSSLIK